MFQTEGRLLPMESEKKPIFTNQELYKLIIPLIIEQFLAVFVGMADTIMVSYSGEAAVSGISLVDTINSLLITLFSSLATGGAVVTSHYLGKNKQKEACNSANQLLFAITSISAVVMLFSLAFNNILLSLIFGKVEDQVMDSAVLYFYLSAASYPFLGIYNGCAALCRSMGNSKVSMKTSLCMNVINISGNAIFLYGFHMGVAGVGTATLISRATAAIIMLFVVSNQNMTIHINFRQKFRIRPGIIKEILHVGIPTGLENSIFQLGKIMVQSLIASFGTASIAANAVGNTVAAFEVIPGSAISLALITVVGQAYGARRYDEAKYYIKKLMKMAYASVGVVSLIICFLTPSIVGFYSLSAEASKIAISIILYHGVACILIWPAAFTLPNALRAANNARFTMKVSILSMWLCRIGLSYVIGRYLGLGALGVWIAMSIDWLFRAIIFTWRIVSGRWLKHTLK